MRILIVFFALLLSSCSVRYVKIPIDLTKHCAIAEIKEATLEEAVRVANVRKEQLIECNKKLDKIHFIEGSIVKQ